MTRGSDRSGFLGPALGLAVLLALAVPGPAVAGDGGSDAADTGLWDTVLRKLDLKSKPATMPDFVQSTHPDPSTLRFIPTGSPPRVPPVPVKSADEIEAAKAALDAAQAAQLSPPAPKPGPPKRKAAKTTVKPKQAAQSD